MSKNDQKVAYCAKTVFILCLKLPQMISANNVCCETLRPYVSTLMVPQ